ncbi:hypothetical protein Pfo_006603 [Paulownia fortunei]|nr:hypothetical protein Pfo_006603 [Paulownia fortunei]
MPLGGESDKFDSLCRNEDNKINVTAKSPNMDEFPASDNLSNGATDDASINLIPELSESKNTLIASEDSQSLPVLSSNSVEMAKDQVLHGANIQAASALGSMPLPGESGKCESPGVKEGDKIIESSKSPNLDESLVLVELSERATNATSGIMKNTDNESGKVLVDEHENNSTPVEVPVSTAELHVDSSAMVTNIGSVSVTTITKEVCNEPNSVSPAAVLSSASGPSNNEVGSQQGAIPGSSMASGHAFTGPVAVASVDQPDHGIVPASSTQATAQDIADTSAVQVPKGCAIDTGIDVDKIEDRPHEQDTNEQEGKDHANEVLASKSNFFDILPSMSTLDPAVRASSSLVSKSGNQSAGESGESNDKKEPDDKDPCGDSSFVSSPVVFGSDNTHGTSEDCQSLLVINSNSVFMEKDQGLNSATVEAAATFGSMPLADNLSKGATDDVGSQQGAIPGSSMASGLAFTGPVAVASVDRPDPGIVPASSPQATAQDIADPSAEQVHKDSATDTDIGADKLEDLPQEQDTNEKEGKGHANEVLASKSNFSDKPSVSTLDPAVRAFSSLFAKSGNQAAGESGESNDKKEPDNKDPCGDSSFVSISVASGIDNNHGTSEVACPTLEDSLSPDNLSDGAENTISEVLGETFENESPKLSADENAKDSAALEVSISTTEVARPTLEDSVAPDNLSDGAANTISEVLGDTFENESPKLSTDEHTKESAALEVSISTTEVARPTLEDSVAPDNLSDGAANIIPEVLGDTFENESPKLSADEHGKDSAALEVSISTTEVARPTLGNYVAPDNFSDGAVNTISEVLGDTFENESGKLPADEHAKGNAPIEVSSSTTEVAPPTLEDSLTPSNLSDGAANSISEVLENTFGNESGKLPADEHVKENALLEISNSTTEVAHPTLENSLAPDNLSDGAGNTISEVLGDTSENESEKLPTDEQEKENAPVEVSISTTEVAHRTPEDILAPNNLSDGAVNTISEVLQGTSSNESGKLPADEHAKENAAVEVSISTTEVGSPNVEDSLASDNLSDRAANTISDVLWDTLGDESGELLADEHVKENVAVEVSISPTEVGLSQGESHLCEEQIPREQECNDTTIKDKDIDSSKPESTECPSLLEESSNREEVLSETTGNQN